MFTTDKKYYNARLNLYSEDTVTVYRDGVVVYWKEANYHRCMICGEKASVLSTLDRFGREYDGCSLPSTNVVGVCDRHLPEHVVFNNVVELAMQNGGLVQRRWVGSTPSFSGAHKFDGKTTVDHNGVSYNVEAVSRSNGHLAIYIGGAHDHVRITRDDNYHYQALPLHSAP